MITLLLFSLATLGLTNILVHGKILDDEHLGVRSWLKRRLGKYGDMLECYECSGFWAGLIMGMTLISFYPWIFLPCAFAGALLGHFYSTVILLIESKIEYVLPEEDHEQQSEETGS
jgi:hypothetical protein